MRGWWRWCGCVRERLCEMRKEDMREGMFVGIVVCQSGIARIV